MIKKCYESKSYSTPIQYQFKSHAEQNLCCDDYFFISIKFLFILKHALPWSTNAVGGAREGKDDNVLRITYDILGVPFSINFYPFTGLCPPKGRTYLNKTVAFRSRHQTLKGYNLGNSSKSKKYSEKQLLLGALHKNDLKYFTSSL